MLCFVEFSVAGPCGGQANWGGASGDQTSTAAPGDKVTLKINYNGGHRSAANRFAVRALCGPTGSGPTQDQMKAATDLDAGVCNGIIRKYFQMEIRLFVSY